MDASNLELPPEVLAEVLTLINIQKWGFGKQKLLLTVASQAAASEDGWCRLGRPALARKAHISERHLIALLAGRYVTGVGRPAGGEMTHQGHVLLLGDPGSGTRGRALRVNPNLWAWRLGDHWSVGPEERDLHLARLMAAVELHSENLALLRAPMRAQLTVLAARALTRATRHPSNRQKPRSPSRDENSSCARPPRAASPSGDAAYTSSSRSLKPSFLHSEGESEEAVEPQPKEALKTGTARVLHRLEAALERPVFGDPRRQVIDYCEAHPERCEELERYAGTLGVIRSVPTAVRTLLERGDTAAVARPAFVVVDPVDEEPDELEGEFAVSKPWADLRGALDDAVRKTRADLDTPACHDGAHGYQAVAEA
jgi:hypothetical protein